MEAKTNPFSGGFTEPNAPPSFPDPEFSPPPSPLPNKATSSGVNQLAPPSAVSVNPEITATNSTDEVSNDVKRTSQLTPQLNNQKTKRGFEKWMRKEVLSKIPWIVILLGTLAGVGYHLSQISLSYVSYKTTQKISSQSEQFEFPDLTFCSDLIIKTENNKMRKMPNYNQAYFETGWKSNSLKIWKYLLYPEVEFMANLTEQQMFRVRDFARASFMYYMAGIRESPLDVTEDKLVACYYHQEMCNLANFTLFYHEEGGACIRFMSTQPFNNLIGSQSQLHLFMSDPAQQKADYFNDYIKYNLAPKQMSLTVVGKNLIYSTNMPVSAQYLGGHHIYVGLDGVYHSRLSTPTYQCWPTRASERRCLIARYHSLECFDFVKDTNLCRQDLYQAYLVSTCDCVSYKWPITEAQRNLTHCLKLPGIMYDNYGSVEDPLTGQIGIRLDANLHNVNNTVPLKWLLNSGDTRSRIKCYARVLARIETATADGSTSSLLPTDMQRRLAACRFGQCTYWDYSDTTNYVDKAGLVTDMALEVQQQIRENNAIIAANNWTANSLYATEYLSTNPVSLRAKLDYDGAAYDVYARQIYSDAYREGIVYSLTVFFTDIGGILGLWIGLSILSVYELIQIVVGLIKGSRCCARGSARVAHESDAKESEKTGELASDKLSLNEFSKKQL